MFPPRLRTGGQPRSRTVARRAPSEVDRRRWLVGLLLIVGLAGPARAMRDAASEPAWRAVGTFGVRREPPQALARSEGGRSLAIGDASGVTWWQGDRRERADLPSVRDLVFDHEQTLWIGTERGLFRWMKTGRPEPRPLGGGENADEIHRLVAAGGNLLLATEAGAYWSSDGRIFQALSVAGPAAAVTRVALRPAELDRRTRATGGLPRMRHARAWLYGTGRLWELRGLVRETGLRVIDARRIDLPRPTDERVPMDLVLDPAGQRLFLVFEDLLAWRSLAEGEEDSTSSAWRTERPTMPPGARIRRLGWAADRVWLATDHGLLEAQSLVGPFRRAASPLGTSSCSDLEAIGRSGAVALCRAGLFRLEPAVRPVQRPVASAPTAPTPPLVPPTPSRSTPLTPPSPPIPRMPARPAPGRIEPIPPDPPVAEIRRRALARAGMEAERSGRLWRGLRRRALWPEVSLRFRMDSDRDRSHDSDQSFVSGETRFLLDRRRDEARGYEASVDLEWDLGGLVYPVRSVELSRELRQVVSLRDDIVDEIHQLYFERQTIRERLGSGAPALEPAELERLRIRARELEAGLDAWTGGWLGRWRRATSAASGQSEPFEAFLASRDAASAAVPIGPDHPDEPPR